MGNGTTAVRVRYNATAGIVAAEYPCEVGTRLPLGLPCRKGGDHGEVSVSVAKCGGVRSVRFDGWDARESSKRP